jgi:hypothetical protein
VRHHLTFSGVLDAIALLPAPAFGGLFVLPAAPEFTHEAGFLHLPFEQAQSKLHIVLLYLDKHGVTSGVTAGGVLPALWQDSH